MDGIHDMGGMQGFGRVPREAEEGPFHEAWEGRVHGLTYALFGQGMLNIDAFRHAIEKLPPKTYLELPYYAKWARAVEASMVASGVLEPGELEARLAGRSSPSKRARPPAGSRPAGFVRDVPDSPRFAPGDEVRVRNLHPSGHTRMPSYVRGKRGIVVRAHDAYVLPDTNAHGRGECPEYVYAVRFTAGELWGDAAESSAPVTVDLFDHYLAPA